MSTPTVGEAGATISLPPGANTIHDTFDGIRYQLVLGLTYEMVERIEQLALDMAHGDKGEVINTALGFLKYARDSALEGKQIWVVDSKGEPETEIVGLLP